MSGLYSLLAFQLILPFFWLFSHPFLLIYPPPQAPNLSCSLVSLPRVSTFLLSSLSPFSEPCSLKIPNTTSFLSPRAVSLKPSLIQPTTSWLFWGQEMQVPHCSLVRLRGPLSPIPPARQGWNPNSPLAPLLVAASPGTFIFLFPREGFWEFSHNEALIQGVGGCRLDKGSQWWDTRKGALCGVIECLADGNWEGLNGVLSCHLEREWQGQVWAIWKRHFEMRLSSDGTTKSEPCGRPLQLTEISDDSSSNIQSMFWLGRQEPHSSLWFQLHFLKAGPAAVLQAVIGLVSRSRDQGGLELRGRMV